MTRTTVAGLLLVAAGWVPLWTVDSYWNPLAFTALWTGVALFAWGVSGRGYPGVRRHLALAAISVPIWWWFELVNSRVANWHYVFTPEYTDLEYSLFATVAFSTVVPAVAAVTEALRRTKRLEDGLRAAAPGARSLSVLEIVAGALMQVGVFMWPDVAFPLVWVAPLIIADGCVGLLGTRSLLLAAVGGPRGRLKAAAAAGLVCGGLWEFWNFWSMPKWEYVLPHLDFARIFEMPVLGYGGYIPFAMFVIQAVLLADLLWLQTPVQTSQARKGRMAVDRSAV
jgi:hypothetical protein